MAAVPSPMRPQRLAAASLPASAAAASCSSLAASPTATDSLLPQAISCPTWGLDLVAELRLVQQRPEDSGLAHLLDRFHEDQCCADPAGGRPGDDPDSGRPDHVLRRHLRGCERHPGGRLQPWRSRLRGCSVGADRSAMLRAVRSTWRLHAGSRGAETGPPPRSATPSHRPEPRPRTKRPVPANCQTSCNM